MAMRQMADTLGSYWTWMIFSSLSLTTFWRAEFNPVRAILPPSSRPHAEKLIAIVEQLIKYSRLIHAVASHQSYLDYALLYTPIYSVHYCTHEWIGLASWSPGQYISCSYIFTAAACISLLRHARMNVSLQRIRLGNKSSKKGEMRELPFFYSELRSTKDGSRPSLLRTWSQPT